MWRRVEGIYINLLKPSIHAGFSLLLLKEKARRRLWKRYIPVVSAHLQNNAIMTVVPSPTSYARACDQQMSSRQTKERLDGCQPGLMTNAQFAKAV